MNARFTVPLLASTLLIVTPVSSHAQNSSGWTAKQEVVDSFSERRKEFNFVEANVPDHELPDPLDIRTLRGTQKVASPEAWMRRRRPQLLNLFRENVYGHRPTTAHKIKYEVVSEDDDLFGIGAKGKQVRATIVVEDRQHSFEFTIAIPKSDVRVPIIVQINNRYLIPLEKVASENDPFWPVEKILRAGFATASFSTKDVDPDEADGYSKGIRALLDAPSSDPLVRWKSLSAWGWAASRVLDYASKLQAIDGKRAAIVGHSRGGKTALWAAAEDRRFKIAYSNQSGCGGAALSRRAFGETVARINEVFPHWFCDKFKTFNNREDKLPVDQHQLIALIAPRAVYVGSADEDLWADPKGEYASVIAAGPVFELFELDHITDPNMPPLDQPRHVGSTGYHIRSGVHNLTEQDWEYFLEFANGYFEFEGN